MSVSWLALTRSRRVIFQSRTALVQSNIKCSDLVAPTWRREFVGRLTDLPTTTRSQKLRIGGSSSIYGPPNDLLRRATVAMLAAGLSLDSIAMPQSIRDGYPGAPCRAIPSFARSRAGTMSTSTPQDLMLATGVLVPAGCFLGQKSARPIHLGEDIFRASLLRLRRATASAPWRRPPCAKDWLRSDSGFWAEIRLGGSEGFNSTSIQESYCLLADLLHVRPDIAGVCAGSELFLCGLRWGRRELLAWKAEQAVHSQPTDYDSGANRSEGAGG